MMPNDARCSTNAFVGGASVLAGASIGDAAATRFGDKEQDDSNALAVAASAYASVFASRIDRRVWHRGR